MALRDSGDIHRLTRFLSEVYEEFAKPEHAAHVLAVQTDPTGTPAVIFGGKKPSAADTDAQAARAGDLHVPAMSEPSDAPTWRMLTTCAEARSNIESDIIDQLPSGMTDFQLMHLNFALLHGIAVVIVLLHDNDYASAPDDSAGRVPVRKDHAAAAGTAAPGRAVSDFGTVINGKVSLDQLGPMVSSPLIRIRFRWQDRPGGFLNVLNSINGVFGQSPPAIGQEDRSVSYARLHVAVGRIAEGDLTVRLHPEDHNGLNWTPALTERMARNISADAVLDAIRRHDPRLVAGYPARPENPVIRIELLGVDVPGRAPRTPY